MIKIFGKKICALNSRTLSEKGVNKTRTGSDRIGLTKPGPDRTGLTKPGWDCVRLTKPGLDPKKKRMAINFRQNSHVTFWHTNNCLFSQLSKAKLLWFSTLEVYMLLFRLNRHKELQKTDETSSHTLFF